MVHDPKVRSLHASPLRARLAVGEPRNARATLTSTVDYRPAQTVVDDGGALTRRFDGVVLAASRAVYYAHGLCTATAVHRVGCQFWDVDVIDACPDNRQGVSRRSAR